MKKIYAGILFYTAICGTAAGDDLMPLLEDPAGTLVGVGDAVLGNGPIDLIPGVKDAQDKFLTQAAGNGAEFVNGLTSDAGTAFQQALTNGDKA